MHTYIDTDDAAHTALDVDFSATPSMWARGGFGAAGPRDNPWASASVPQAAPFDQEFYLVINRE
jgi:hypothetical protein